MNGFFELVAFIRTKPHCLRSFSDAHMCDRTRPWLFPIPLWRGVLCREQLELGSCALAKGCPGILRCVDPNLVPGYFKMYRSQPGTPSCLPGLSSAFLHPFSQVLRSIEKVFVNCRQTSSPFPVEILGFVRFGCGWVGSHDFLLAFPKVSSVLMWC